MIKYEELKNLTNEQLYELAREYQIKGRTDMGRDEIIFKLSEKMLENTQNRVETEIRDLGVPMSPGSSNITAASSYMGVAQDVFKNQEVVRRNSPFFDGDPLPEAYGDNKIVIIPKNPQWAYAYWEISGDKIEEAKKVLGNEVYDKTNLTIRVYDVTMKEFDGANANSFSDIELPKETKEWFIGGLSPKASYVADVGIKGDGDNYIVFARSNSVSTPSDSISENVDEEWMIIEEYFKKILDRSTAGRLVDGKWVGGMGASGGMLGSSEEMIGIMLKRLFMEKTERREMLISHLERTMGSIAMGSISAGSLSAGNLSRAPGEVEKIGNEKSKDIGETEKKKDFWLRVGTELILYGATEPDAKVSVMGMPVKLEKDGTFTLRFALPNGNYELPVVAVSADGDDTRSITPVVDRTEK